MAMAVLALAALVLLGGVDAFQRPAGFLPAPAARRAQQGLARAAGGVVASRWALRLQEQQKAQRAQSLSRMWAMSTTTPGGPYHGPEFMVGERDACGVGFIADMKGKVGPRVVLDKALVALGCMEHRGACSADSVGGWGLGSKGCPCRGLCTPGGDRSPCLVRGFLEDC